MNRATTEDKVDSKRSYSAKNINNAAK